jgi:hypothetical protein
MVIVRPEHRSFMLEAAHDIMDKEQIKKLAQNKQFIPGIYNYCDRWCERCQFTSRCLNFALRDEESADPESRDITNELFWRKLAETFQVTLDLLKEAAEREGIDLDSLDSGEPDQEQRYNEEVAKNHECCRAARAYGEMVDDWFDSEGDLFGQPEDELNLNELLEIPTISPVGEGAGLEEAVQVVRWYQHQIYVKLMRAARGRLEEKPEIDDEFYRDSDGSAKVALIGIDRSIGAWGAIRTYYPLGDRQIVDLLVHLDRLRRSVERVFPDARGFIRPGFDKVHLHS